VRDLLALKSLITCILKMLLFKFHYLYCCLNLQHN